MAESLPQTIKRTRDRAYWAEVAAVVEHTIVHASGFYDRARYDEARAKLDSGKKLAKWEKVAKPMTLGEALEALPDEYRDRLLELDALWLVGLISGGASLEAEEAPTLRHGYMFEDDDEQPVLVVSAAVVLHPPPVPPARRGAKPDLSKKKRRTKKKAAKAGAKSKKAAKRSAEGKPAKPTPKATPSKRRSAAELEAQLRKQKSLYGDPEAGGGLTKKELRGRLGCSGKSLNALLDRLIASGDLSHIGGDPNGTLSEQRQVRYYIGKVDDVGSLDDDVREVVGA